MTCTVTQLESFKLQVREHITGTVTIAFVILYNNNGNGRTSEAISTQPGALISCT